MRKIHRASLRHTERMLSLHRMAMAKRADTRLTMRPEAPIIQLKLFTAAEVSTNDASRFHVLTQDNTDVTAGEKPKPLVQKPMLGDSNYGRRLAR